MKRILPAVLIGTLGLGLAALNGCGDQSVSPELSSGTVIDESTITAVGAESAAATAEMMNGHGVPMPLAGRLPGRVPSGCPYDAASGRFVCVDEKVDDGRDVSRSYAFLDASGNLQAAYDENTTAAINFESSVTESHTGPNGGTNTGQHSRSLTASGLAGAETSWTWNGSGSGQAHREGPPPRRGMGGRRGEDAFGASRVSVDLTMSGTITDVVVPMPRTPGNWPLSGTITETITATFTGGPNDGQTRTRTITITFNGTQYASLTDGSETISIDLANRGHEGGPRPGGHR